MTNDFKDDLQAAAEAEGKLVVIAIFEKDMSGAIIRSSDGIPIEDAINAIRAGLE